MVTRTVTTLIVRKEWRKKEGSKVAVNRYKIKNLLVRGIVIHELCNIWVRQNFCGTTSPRKLLLWLFWGWKEWNEEGERNHSWLYGVYTIYILKFRDVIVEGIGIHELNTILWASKYLFIPRRELRKQCPRGSTWQSFHFNMCLTNKIGVSKSTFSMGLFEILKTFIPRRNSPEQSPKGVQLFLLIHYLG